MQVLKSVGILRPLQNPDVCKSWICGRFANMDCLFSKLFENRCPLSNNFENIHLASPHPEEGACFSNSLNADPYFQNLRTCKSMYSKLPRIWAGFRKGRKMSEIGACDKNGQRTVGIPAKIKLKRKRQLEDASTIRLELTKY